jgi:hypothetical protein
VEFAADLDGDVVLVAFEEKAAVIYRVVPPLTLVRETLDLRGATIRYEVDISDSERPAQLSVRFADGERPAFAVRLHTRDDVQALRDELEKRAFA